MKNLMSYEDWIEAVVNLAQSAGWMELTRRSWDCPRTRCVDHAQGTVSSQRCAE